MTRPHWLNALGDFIKKRLYWYPTRERGSRKLSDLRTAAWA